MVATNLDRYQVPYIEQKAHDINSTVGDIKIIKDKVSNHRQRQWLEEAPFIRGL